MRRLIPAVLLLCCALACGVLGAPAPRAQSVGLYATGGFERAAIGTEGFDAFTETYNDYYVQRLDAPFESIEGSLNRPTFGAAIRLNGPLMLAFGYQYGRTSQERGADLGAIEQGYDLTITDHTVTTELGAHVGGGLYVAGVVAGVFRGVALDYRTTYADGSTSVGNEIVPNGHYTGSHPHIDAGVGVGLDLGRFVIPIRVTYPVMEFEGNPLLDPDQQARSYFPADWPRYLEDAAGLDEDNSVREDEFSGLRITVGVEVRLLPF